MKVLWDIWLNLVLSNISWLKVLWDIWSKFVWLSISQLKVLWDIWFNLVWLNISRLKVERYLILVGLMKYFTIESFMTCFCLFVFCLFVIGCYLGDDADITLEVAFWTATCVIRVSEQSPFVVELVVWKWKTILNIPHYPDLFWPQN